MLGALVGEGVASGMVPGPGAAMRGTPPSAFAMGALAVAAEGGWSMRGTMRVWAMHHEAATTLPGLGPWSVLGDAYVPETGDAHPAYRPWTAALPWLCDDPAGRAAVLLARMHGVGGPHHQAGIAAVRVVQARSAGAPASVVPGIVAEHAALVPGEPVADALRQGAAAGWCERFDDAMARVAGAEPSRWKPMFGFVAGIVAQAGSRAVLPGWCHMAALTMEEDVLSALGMFERVAAARPPGDAWVPVVPEAVPAGMPPAGMVGRMLAGVRSGVAAFSRREHPRHERS